MVYLHHGDGMFPFWEVPSCNLRYLHAQLFTSILYMSTRDLNFLVTTWHIHPDGFTDRPAWHRQCQKDRSPAS